MKVVLNNEQQQVLRNNQIISGDEIACKEGDLYIAENVLTGARRKINASFLHESSNKKILFG